MELQLTGFETAIKNFLDNYAKEDEAFAITYAKPNKSISECCKYIMQQVEKNRKQNARCVACSDDEVYGLAIHYYDEDDIKVEGPKTKVADLQHGPTPPAEPAKPKATRKKSKAKVADPNIPEPLEIPLF